MSLQLEKSDEVAKSKVRVTAYQNHFSKDSPASYGRVQAPSDRVTASNLVASLATRHLGVDPGLILYAARLLHEETMRQLQEGKSVEILGLGTAYLATKGGMKGLNPSLEDIPKMTLKFRPAREIKERLKLVKAGSVTVAEILPEINTIQDKKTGIINGDVKKNTIVQVKGKRLKIEGDPSNANAIGIFYIKDGGGRGKIPNDNIIINEPSNLLFALPNDLTVGSSYTLEIVTQKKYGDNRYAKTIKKGVSSFSFKIVI